MAQVGTFVVRTVSLELHDNELEGYLNNLMATDPDLMGKEVVHFQYIPKGWPYQLADDILSHAFYVLMIFYVIDAEQ